MRARLAASLLTLAALIAVALVLAAPGRLRWQANPGSACEDLTALSDSLDLSSLADQAVIRARAVQLAAALRASSQTGTGQLEVDDLEQRVLVRLQVVINDSSATSHDLAAALTPLASSCGIELQR